MAKEFSRTSRVEQLVLRRLSELLRREVNDPRIKNIVITRTTVSRDLGYAKIYYTTGVGCEMPAAELKMLKKALDKAKPFLRTMLAASCELRYTPALVFVLDESQTHRQHMMDVIDKAVASVAS